MWSRPRWLRGRRRNFRSRAARWAMLGRSSRSDASADGVLLLGPLYHLTERADRLSGIARGASRFAERGARVRGRDFAICVADGWTFAGLRGRSEIRRDFAPRFEEWAAPESDGQSALLHVDVFSSSRTNCEREIEEAGFTFEKVIAMEGPVWVMGNFRKHWDDPKMSVTVAGVFEDGGGGAGAAWARGAFDWDREESVRPMVHVVESLKRGSSAAKVRRVRTERKPTKSVRLASVGMTVLW